MNIMTYWGLRENRKNNFWFDEYILLFIDFNTILSVSVFLNYLSIDYVG